MIKEMQGWKVIRKYGRVSARAPDWIQYLPNQTTVPRIQGSKLFFFVTKEAANLFANSEEIVVPCIAKGVTKPKYLMAQGHVLDFWQWKQSHPNRSIKEYPNKKERKWTYVEPVAYGTLWANSITCLE